MVHGCSLFEKSIGLFQVFRNSLRMCGCAFAYICAPVTNECCRPHPPGLRTDPSFPHEQEEFSWDPRGDVSITSNIWGTSGEPIPGQADAFLEKTHHLFDCIFPNLFSSSCSPILNLHSIPCQFPVLVFPM